MSEKLAVRPRLDAARRIALALAALVIAALLPRGALADEPATPKFDLLEFRILGNTVLAPREIEAVVYPFSGPDRTFHDVEAARAALENRYHELGYGTVFVDIPEQDVDEGIVRLKVVEGRLANVQLNGSRYFSGRRIRAQLTEATPGNVPKLPELQAELQQVNTETSDRTVVPVMKAGAEPGTVDLALNVNEQFPLHFDAEINNAHTANTEPTRLLLNAHLTNAFGRLDDASLQYQTAPQNRHEVGVLALNYAARFDAGREQLAMYYIHSNSQVASVGALDVLGNGRIVGLRAIESLGTDPRQPRTITAGLDWKDFAQDVQVSADSRLSTPVRYLDLSVALDVGGHSDRLDWGLEFMPVFGTRGAINQTGAFAVKCYQCRPNFFYTRASGNLTLHAPKGWSITGRVSGQGAGEPVVANEQYSIGGTQTVRGYLEADSLGDTGVSGTIQLGAPAITFKDTLRFGPYAFFDIGRVRSLEPLDGQVPATDLRSVGVGFDFGIGKSLTGYATWADPLVSTSTTRRSQSRFLFSVRGSL